MALAHVHGFSAAALESPWMWPLARQLARFRGHQAFPTLAELEALLLESAVISGQRPLRPVQQTKSKNKRKARRGLVHVGELYDVRIAERGELPTRLDDWHDFFNVLAFAAWPLAKRALHARQARLLRERLGGDTVSKLPGARTREQDALTLFDEGGVLLVTAPGIELVLNDRELDLDAVATDLSGRGLLWVVPFGHALFEHLAAGLAPPLAFPCTLALAAFSDEPATLLSTLDRALATQLADSSAFCEPSGVRGLSLVRHTPRFSEARRNLVPPSGGG